MFQHLHWSSLISAEIHHLQHPWMMLNLHSGPCQICLSVSQLSDEETLAFEFKSANVWKSATISKETDRVRGMKRTTHTSCGNVWHQQSMQMTVFTHSHTGKKIQRMLYKREGEEEEGKGENRWIMGRENTIFFVRMSRKRVERIFSHNSIRDVMVWVAALGLGTQMLFINFQLRKLILGMNKTSDKHSFFSLSQLPTSHLLLGRVFDTFLGVSVLN